MTVIATADIEFVGVNGWDDPSYPIAFWRVSEQVAGDVSGGVRTIQINLKAANVQVGNVFSLEQLSAVDTEVAADDLIMGTDGFQVFGEANVVPHWRIPLATVDAQTDVVFNIDHDPSKFLGRGATAATAATLSFSLANDDAEILSIVAEGYMWSARSTSQGQGGYRRPIDGLYHK